MKIKTISPETSYLNSRWTTSLGMEGINILRNNFKMSERKRHRFCFHQNPDVLLHDIIISYDKNSYIPPNKHIGKPETLLILQGRIQVFLFNDNGKCIRALNLGPMQSGLPFILRIPPNTWHGLRCISDEPCIMKETITGPYSKESLMWSDFAPSELENSKKNNGYRFYDELARTFSDELDQKPITEYIFLSENNIKISNQFPLISINDLKLLKSIAEKSNNNRSRICLHSNAQDALQEMLVYLAPNFNMPVSYNINKDKSLLVLMGSGKSDFYADESKPVESINLLPFLEKADNKVEEYFFSRVNRFIAHKINPGIDGLIAYEATTGPFIKEETQYMTHMESD